MLNMSSANYWLAKETAKIVINLGCDMEVTSVSLTNTHHAHWGGFAAKQFRVKLRLWEDNKVWKSILNGTLDDPTGKVANSSALGSTFLSISLDCSNVKLTSKPLTWQ